MTLPLFHQRIKVFFFSHSRLQYTTINIHDDYRVYVSLNSVAALGLGVNR